jgi:hypothetical protein
MPHRYTVLRFLSVLAALCLQQTSHAQDAPVPGKKEAGTMVRFLCTQSVTEAKEKDEDEKITLARMSEDGKWIEVGEIGLRSPFITSWIGLKEGQTHLVRKEGEKMISLGSFTIAPKMKNAIIIMLPDFEKKSYKLQLIDPAKLEFQKGKALIVNYSTLSAVVSMGKETKTVSSGQQIVETIKADGDGMYPLLIGHLDKDKKIVLCYDRRVSSNPNTRTFILLFPDPDNGLRAMSLSEFDTNE